MWAFKKSQSIFNRPAEVAPACKTSWELCAHKYIYIPMGQRAVMNRCSYSFVWRMRNGTVQQGTVFLLLTW